MMSQLSHASNEDKQTTRICAEIAIREWPQKWPELTEQLLSANPKAPPLHLVRIFAEIQFFVNNQNIPNLTRQKELTKSLCEVHHHLIKLVLGIVCSTESLISIKNEALSQVCFWIIYSKKSSQ